MFELALVQQASIATTRGDEANQRLRYSKTSKREREEFSTRSGRRRIHTKKEGRKERRMSTHTYKGLEGETTEWDDLQVKYGNRPKPEEPWKPDEWKPEAEPRSARQKLDECTTTDELDELGDDDEAFADDRFLEEYRQKRMAEMQREASARNAGINGGGGELVRITRKEWVAKVTEASAVEGAYVFVHLEKEGKEECTLVNEFMTKLAAKYPRTRFCVIKSTDAVANFPDANTPTILVYRDKQVVNTLVGLTAFGGRLATVEGMEWAFASVGEDVLKGASETTTEAQRADMQKRFLESLLRQREEEEADIDD